MKKKVHSSKTDKTRGDVTPGHFGSVRDEADATRATPESVIRTPSEKSSEQPGTPANSDKVSADAQLQRRRRRKKRLRARRPLMIGALASVALALVAFACVAMMTADVVSLQSSLEKARAENAAWEKKYQDVLFAARDVAADNEVRGRVIIRDATQKRVLLPGIKMRLYRRAAIEAYLNERHARIAEAGGNDRARVTSHFLKDLPTPLESCSTNSDARFDFKIPEPGEYVIQTSIRSGVNGETRLWFVAFDSRDPLNTGVDITESNSVQQFNPLFMLMDGR